MGRRLATGVMTRFEITKKNDWGSDSNFVLSSELENILKDISHIIDPSIYELVEKHEDCYDFALKTEIFNNNIHELIGEISSLTCPNVDCFWNLEEELKEKNIDINSKEFMGSYPLSVKVDEKGKYFIETNTEKIEEDYPFHPFYWIIDSDRLYKNIEINAAIILLWIDENKYCGEDETNMLSIINNMKARYYSSPLSKALVYYISG